MNKDYTGWVLGAASLVVALLCAFVLYNTRIITNINKEEAKKWAEMQSVYREQLVEMDSTTNIDSLVNIIRCNQIFIIDREADLINDIRQETNNNIDKLNQWLAYAICLISIIGVFVPLWVQHVRDKKYKADFEKIEKEFENIKKEEENKIEKLDKKEEKREKKLNNFINNNKKKLNNLNKGIQKDKDLMEMRSSFLTLSIGIQHRLINNQPERERLLHYLCRNAVDATSRVSELSFREKDLKKRRDFLIESLLHLSGFIFKLKTISTGGRIRKWDNALDSIRYLIQEICDGYDNTRAWSDIKTDLDKFISEISKSNFLEVK